MILAFTLLLLVQEGQGSPDYDGLVALGLAEGRAGRYAEARGAFERAIAVDPRRPEAWVERGGLEFLEKKYDAAARDLEKALALDDDAYTRDLLASSLHLAGRSDEALVHWNLLGQPAIGSIEITGLVHTKDRIARRELSLSEGQVLRLDRLRESRLRLAEVGVFERATLRPVPLGDGKADLQVALLERHGLFRSWPEFAVITGENALNRRLFLRYSNLGGSGASFGALYRWESSRPQLALSLEWPRPLGLPGYLRLQSFRGRQSYDLGEPLTLKSRGIDLSLRHVLGSRTVGQLTLRARDRLFTSVHPDAPPGAILGLEAGVERRLVETRRQRLDASLRLFEASDALASDLSFRKGIVSLGYRGYLSPPQGEAVERSVLAMQVRWGRGSATTPLDEMFAPGGSREMELPLRAHRQTRRGVLGQTPIGRTLTLANVEWRRRLLDRTGAKLGIVLFYDAGRIGDGPLEAARWLHDFGAGLRLSLVGSPVVRVDYGHSASDGKNALFFGINEAF